MSNPAWIQACMLSQPQDDGVCDACHACHNKANGQIDWALREKELREDVYKRQGWKGWPGRSRGCWKCTFTPMRCPALPMRT